MLASTSNQVYVYTLELRGGLLRPGDDGVDGDDKDASCEQDDVGPEEESDDGCVDQSDDGFEDVGGGFIQDTDVDDYLVVSR